MQIQFDNPEDYLKFFKEHMESYTAELTDYVNRAMKNDGDTEETSQRICMLNAINDVESIISGTTVDDLNLDLELEEDKD